MFHGWELAQRHRAGDIASPVPINFLPQGVQSWRRRDAGTFQWWTPLRRDPVIGTWKTPAWGSKRRVDPVFGFVWHCGMSGFLAMHQLPPPRREMFLLCTEPHRQKDTMQMLAKCSAAPLALAETCCCFIPFVNTHHLASWGQNEDLGIVLQDVFPSMAPQSALREPWNTKHLGTATNNKKQWHVHCLAAFYNPTNDF